MTSLHLIVEGHGEVEAAPILVRRIAWELYPELASGLTLTPPRRVARQRVVKPGELEHVIDLESRRSSDGRLLLILDADDDCPRDLAPRLLERALHARPDRRIGVVLPVSAFESWFLVDPGSWPRAHAGDATGARFADTESIRNPKVRLNEATGYSPTADQARFAAALDLTRARSAPSFDKLCREVARLLAP